MGHVGTGSIRFQNRVGKSLEKSKKNVHIVELHDRSFKESTNNLK